MTRDEARARWAATGLSTDALSLSSLNRLKTCIDRALEAAGPDVLRMQTQGRVERQTDAAGGLHVSILCKGPHFTDRQAVSLEPSGFVGFAGWADDQNVQPFLSGFLAWLEDLSDVNPPT